MRNIVYALLLAMCLVLWDCGFSKVALGGTADGGESEEKDTVAQKEVPTTTEAAADERVGVVDGGISKDVGTGPGKVEDLPLGRGDGHLSSSLTEGRSDGPKHGQGQLSQELSHSNVQQQEPPAELTQSGDNHRAAALAKVEVSLESKEGKPAKPAAGGPSPSEMLNEALTLRDAPPDVKAGSQQSLPQQEHETAKTKNHDMNLEKVSSLATPPDNAKVLTVESSSAHTLDKARVRDSNAVSSKNVQQETSSSTSKVHGTIKIGTILLQMEPAPTTTETDAGSLIDSNAMTPTTDETTGPSPGHKTESKTVGDTYTNAPRPSQPPVSNALPLHHSVDKADFSLCSSSLFALAALATLAVAAAAPAH